MTRNITRGTTCHYPRCQRPISTKYGLLCQRHEASYRQGEFRLRGLKQEARQRAANARAAKEGKDAEARHGRRQAKRTAPRKQATRRRQKAAAR